MQQIYVRTARKDDAETIARIHVATWQQVYRGQVPDSFLDAMPETLADRTQKWEATIGREDPGVAVLVAEIDGTVAGFVIVNPCRDEDMDKGVTGEVGAIYVDSAFMKAGAGSALMDGGLEFLRQQGFTQATLWVLTSHENARAWYEKKGWKPDGKTKTDDRGQIVLHETRYVREL